MTKAALVRLDDLSRPQFSVEAQQILDMMAALAPNCSLDSDALHAKASADTGLHDFGEGDYRERLDVYLAALAEIDGMQPAGVVNFYGQLLQLLKNRLLLSDLRHRHPEIDDIELQPPVVIAGLPRTGTTHLHNMLAAPTTFRTMPYWESVEPFPLPQEAGVEPDPRRVRMDVAVGVINTVMPHFSLMHEMTADHVHEEIQLLANDFSTMLFETLGHVPRWRDYLPDPRPDAALSIPGYPAQGDAIPAWRPALAAQVAPASGTGSGAGSGVPGQHRVVHAP